MILHIVLYQPRASASSAELTELANAVQAASRTIPTIQRVRVGKAVDLGFGYQNWPQDRNSGNVAIFEFSDRDGLEAYLAHDAHRHLAEMFWKTCDNPVVLDASVVDPAKENLADWFGQTAD